MNADSKPASRFRWVVAGLFFLAYMVAGADRANIGVVVPFIKQEYHLSNTDIGALASLFYLTYAIVQIPAGYLFGRYGIRKLLTGSLVLTSLATLLIGFTSSVLQLKLARALLGAAEGPINIGIVSIINRWFPPSEKGLATGIFMSSIKVAPAIVPPLCAWIVHLYGWREVFFSSPSPGSSLRCCGGGWSRTTRPTAAIVPPASCSISKAPTPTATRWSSRWCTFRRGSTA